MHIKVIHKPSQKVLPDGVDFEVTQKVFYVNRREDTYTALFDMVYKEIIGDANEAKKRENFRLRMYQEASDIMLDTYTGREHETLEILKIYPMRTLAFEEKTDEDVFADYNPNLIELKVIAWRSGLQSLAEDVLKPKKVQVLKDLTMEQF
jgi:hypothetical protein